MDCRFETVYLAALGALASSVLSRRFKELRKPSDAERLLDGIIDLVFRGATR
jgi:hypothetical protein